MSLLFVYHELIEHYLFVKISLTFIVANL